MTCRDCKKLKKFTNNMIDCSYEQRHNLAGWWLSSHIDQLKADKKCKGFEKRKVMVTT